MNRDVGIINGLYPNSAVVEVQADDASGQGRILVNPSFGFVLDDGFKIWTSLMVVSETQIILCG